jgi:hypothetical protein
MPPRRNVVVFGVDQGRLCRLFVAQNLLHARLQVSSDLLIGGHPELILSEYRTGDRAHAGYPLSVSLVDRASSPMWDCDDEGPVPGDY